jgi:hypothetical protein
MSFRKIRGLKFKHMENKKRNTRRQLIETIHLHQQLIVIENTFQDYLNGSKCGDYQLKRDLEPFVNKVRETIEILKDEALESNAWNELEGFD